MRYKVLKSAAHNFTHSFVSYTNYGDGGWIIDDLRHLAREANGERIAIHWLPDDRHQSPELTPRIINSIVSRKAYLSLHFRSSGADIEMVSSFRSEIFLLPSKQIRVEAHLEDNRGRRYVTAVTF